MFPCVTLPFSDFATPFIYLFFPKCPPLLLQQSPCEWVVVCVRTHTHSVSHKTIIMLLVFSVLLPPPPPAHCVTKVLCYEEGEEVWLSCFGWARSFPPLCPSSSSAAAAFKQKEERAYQLGTDFPPAAALMSRFYTAARKVDRFVPRLSTLFRPSVRPLARSLSCSNTTTTLRLYVQTSRNGSHTHTTLSSSFLFISFFYYFISSLLFFYVCLYSGVLLCVCVHHNPLLLL